MRLTFGIILSALLSIVVRAIEPPAEGYTVEEIEWEVEGALGQKFRALGTIEEVLDQVRAINPHYNRSGTTVRRHDNNRGFFGKRYDEDHTVCYPDGMGAADGNFLVGGCKYLRGIKGQPTNGPGPGKCGRLSCSNNSAIWWCNDSTQTKTLSSFSEVADAAEAICNKCWMSSAVSDGAFENLCGGQMFMKDDWNVIVRDAKC